jgi:hypothetical protein
MLLAYLIPGLSLYTHRRQALGVLFLLLQVTVVGWVAGAWVAVRNLKRQRTRHRIHTASPEWAELLKN